MNPLNPLKHKLKALDEIQIKHDSNLLFSLKELSSSKFEKDYLDVSVPEKIYNKSKEYCDLFHNIVAKYHSNTENIKNLENKHSNLKEPKMFGKQKYYKTKSEIENEISQLKKEIDNSENELKSLKPEYNQNKAIVDRYNHEKEANNKKYSKDEKIFLDYRNALIKKTLDKYLACPFSLEKGQWDVKKIEWYKSFIKLNQKENVFEILPKECLSYLLPIVFTATINLEDWIGEESSMIIDGEELKFNEMLIETIIKYLDYCENKLDSDEYVCCIYSKVYHAKSVMALTKEKLLAIENNQYYELDEEIIHQIENSYNCIEKGKKISISKNNEVLLDIFNNLNNAMDNLWKTNEDGKIYKTGTLGYYKIYSLDEINSGYAFEKRDKWYKIYNIGKDQYIAIKESFVGEYVPKCAHYYNTGKTDYVGNVLLVN